jgi:integrase
VRERKKNTMTRPFGYIRKLPSGKFQASYPGPDGERHTAPTTYRHRPDAQRWLRHEQTAIEQGAWDLPENQDTLFGEFCAGYIAKKSHPRTGKGLRESTQQHYRQLLATHLAEFAHTPLADISYQVVEQWWSQGTANGAFTARARAYKLMSATMKRAVSHGLIDKSPCTLPGVHNASTGKTVIAATPEEVSALIDTINPRFRFLVFIMGNAALRCGEAIKLRRSDMRLREVEGIRQWEVSVTKSIAWIKGKPVETDPKSAAGIRTVTLHPDLSPFIEAHLATLEPDGDPLLSVNGEGGHVRHDVFTNSFRRAVKKVGADPRLTPHSLRHCAASEYHRAGANFAELKRFLGDSSDSVVTRYLHVTDRADDLTKNMRPMFGNTAACRSHRDQSRGKLTTGSQNVS